MNKLIISAIGTALTFTVNAAEVDYGSAFLDNYDNWGTQKKEKYNVAIRVDDPGLIGKKVTSITVPWDMEVPAENCFVFLTKDLKNKDGIVNPDITKVEFTPSGQGVIELKVSLSEPYLIEAGGFYAGYSFSLSSIETDKEKYPLIVAPISGENTMMISTSRTYMKWNLPSALKNWSTPLTVQIDGDFHDNTMGIKSINDTYATPGEETLISVIVTNHGLNEVNNFDWEYTVNAKTVTGHQNLVSPLGAKHYGTPASLAVSITAPEILGEYTGTFRVTKVNGTENPESSSKADNLLKVVEVAPHHNVVMEEYTGTWCGWCPRGWVAIELLKEQFPNNFIAHAYHSGDIMTVTDKIPMQIEGYPMADIDRVWMGDPYYGNSNGFGMPDIVAARIAKDVPANIEVSARYTDNDSKIEVTSSAYFFLEFENNPYRISYVVTEDGLGAKSYQEREWLQHNYFPGKDPAQYGGPGLEFLFESPAYMMLEFSDVVIATSPYSGEVGSLPASVGKGRTPEHKYSFNTSEFVSNTISDAEGNPVNLFLNPDKIYVTAVIVNPATGEIVNSAKTRVTGSVGVNGISAERTVNEINFFDLSGRKLLQAPDKGLYLRQEIYSDGTIEVTKHIK